MTYQAPPVHALVAKAPRYRMPAPPRYRVSVGPLTASEQDGQMGGGYIADAQTGTIRLSRRDPYNLGHETGHLLDMQVLTEGDRRYFTRLMGDQGPWWQGTGDHGYQSPAEHFADYYSYAANGIDPRHGATVTYTAVDSKRLRQFSAAMDRIRRRHGLGTYQGFA